MNSLRQADAGLPTLTAVGWHLQVITSATDGTQPARGCTVRFKAQL